ncbi:MAG: glycosyltransferase family 39 protein, partial [Candidatus Thermoplasmatota archaeon]|nr:glycosyltransferase family 39 protein [Candidatus Thermoplasmatota archaeon]
MLRRKRPFEPFKGIMQFFMDNPALLLILIIAIWIRLYGISTESFWLDESMTGLRCRWDFNKMIDSFAAKDHLPLYFSMMWMYGKIFGTSEIALRAPSLFFGVLSVGPIFLLGSRISKKVGNLSALLSAILPTTIYYSQEARMYSMLLFLSALSLYLLTRMLDTGEKKRTVITTLFILVNLSIVYTHYFGLLFVGLECTSILLISITRRKEGFASMTKRVIRNIWPGILPILSFLPWFVYVQSHYPFSGHVTGGGLKLSTYLIFNMYLFLGGNYHFHYEPIHGVTLVSSLILVSLSVVGIVIMFSKSLKDTHQRELMMVLMPLMILPPIIVYFVSLYWQSIFNYRYMI